MNRPIFACLFLLFTCGLSAQNKGYDYYTSAQEMLESCEYALALAYCDSAMAISNIRGVEDVQDQAEASKKVYDDVMNALSDVYTYDGFIIAFEDVRKDELPIAENMAFARSLINYRLEKELTDLDQRQVLDKAYHKLAECTGINHKCQPCKRDMAYVLKEQHTMAYTSDLLREIAINLVSLLDTLIENDPCEISLRQDKIWIQKRSHYMKDVSSTISKAKKDIEECGSDPEAVESLDFEAATWDLETRKFYRAKDRAKELVENYPGVDTYKWLYLSTTYELCYTERLDYTEVLQVKEEIDWSNKSEALAKQASDSAAHYLALAQGFESLRNWTKASYWYGKSAAFQLQHKNLIGFSDCSLAAEKYRVHQGISYARFEQSLDPAFLMDAIESKLQLGGKYLEEVGADLETYKTQKSIDADYFVARIDYLIKSEKHEEAENEIKAYRSSHGRNSIEVINAFALLYAETDPPKALRYFKKLAAKEEKGGDQFLEIGELFSKKYQSDGMILPNGKGHKIRHERYLLLPLEYYHWAMQKGVPESEVAQHIGRIHYLLGEYDRTVSYYNEAFKVLSFDPELSLDYCELLFVQKQYKNTLDSLTAIEDRGDEHFLTKHSYEEFEALKALTLANLMVAKKMELKDTDWMEGDMQASQGYIKETFERYLNVSRNHVPKKPGEQDHVIFQFSLLDLLNQLTVDGIANFAAAQEDFRIENMHRYMAMSSLPEAAYAGSPVIQYCSQMTLFQEQIGKPYFKK
jgi:hypothetical protein